MSVISEKQIGSKIYLIRGVKVMFDNDLAELYQVQTKVLNQSVKRNIHRFPKDFMPACCRQVSINLKRIHYTLEVTICDFK